MYRILIAGLTILLTFDALANRLPADDSIRVMSFNIRFGKANDGKNHWKTRHQIVLKTIRDYSPDLLGTQETLKFQADYLQENLQEYQSIGRSRDKDPNQGEQCTVFFRKQRFELLQNGQFWLSENPEKVASKSWDSSLPRIATWVKLRDKQTKKQFYFLNTHFDHRGKTAREEAAKLIAKRVAKFDAPTVITGDFNCGENSKPYQSFMKNDAVKILDTYRVKFTKATKRRGDF